MSNQKRGNRNRAHDPLWLGVDGEFTFDENLCDVESLEMITDKMLSNIEKQDELPGVNFTKEQTFFINIAQVSSIIKTLQNLQRDFNL